MPRRTRTRLGAPTEAHEREIAREAAIADRAADFALAAFAGRKTPRTCALALLDLKTAIHSHGSMFANIFALPGADRQHHDGVYNRIGKKITDAREKLTERCFKAK